ncbi:hypothetical protein SG34_027350 [Thalassomonas viridans]|uniref:Uncharacterized protein n=1 Tax=Thalassomonas viridans TaxID=137584 RepID=A0AAE9Z1A7_9GAMM|nr:hypothetical protein [Thalassomonas viridans]WDE04976.1 hypothetical protein SG34_027350 [Thalassomonas viridans]
MNKAADKPLYRQFTPMLAVTFLSVFLLLPLTLVLVYLDGQQQALSQQEQLMRVLQQNQYLQYRQKNHVLFTQLLSERHAGQFSLLYQRLLDNWQSLAGQITDTKVQNQDIRLEELSAGVRRLAAASKDNLRLKQQSIIQLQRLADALDTIIFSRQEQLALLYQQLQADKVSDAVTVSRARAQGRIYTELAGYYRLENLLDTLLVSFASLDLQLSLAGFEELRRSAGETVSLAGELTAGEDLDVRLTALAVEADKVSALLLTQERTLAKWQGHLRLAHEFRQALSADREKIRTLLADQPFAGRQERGLKPPGDIAARLLAYTRGQPLFFAVSLSAVLVIAVLLLQLRQHLRLRAYARQSLALCDRLTAGGEVDEQQINSLENLRFSRLFGRVSQPEITADEVKRLDLNYRMQLETLAQMNRVLYWRQDGELILAGQLSRGSKYLFNRAVTFDSWRHAFPREEVKKLTAVAREVKSSGESQTVRVFSRGGELLVISLLWRELHFFGTVINADMLAGYEQKLERLTREHKEQQLSRDQLAQQEYQRLHQLLTVAKLQLQAMSFGAAIPGLQLHRQLALASGSLSRYRLLTALRGKQHVMSLQDVDLVNEIHAVMYNLMPQAQLQHNRLWLDCDPYLNSRVQLDARLFHELFYSLAELMFAGITKGQLGLVLKVKDQHPGQQRVQVSAQISKGQSFSRLPAALELLNPDTAPKNGPHGQEDKELVEYFQLLLARHHGINLQAEPTGQGYRLVFELPLTQVKNSKPGMDLPEPGSLSLAYLSGSKELQNRLGDLLQPLKLDAYPDTGELFSRLTPQQLKSRPLDLLMVSEDLFAGQKEQIMAHLGSLPDALQPDLLVLQQQPLRVCELGLYSPVGHLLSRQNLLREIEGVLLQERQSNLLFGPELCRQYAFTRSGVEVLLGVSEPSKHQGLISLLDWFGLQVCVAANAESMQDLWYSGRFLVLVTEFAMPDFTELDQGTSFERGLFSLSGAGDDMQSINSWRLGSFPPLSDLPALVELLRPWLEIAAQENLKEQEKLMPEARQQPEVESASGQAPLQVPLSGISAYAPELQELVLQEQLFHLSDEESELPAAFDLQAYTRHQASPELAAYMLEHYLADNRDYLAQLRVAFQSQHFRRAEKMLGLLKQNAVILAAENLLALCRKMQELTEQKAANQAGVLLEQARQELDAIENYAESI